MREMRHRFLKNRSDFSAPPKYHGVSDWETITIYVSIVHKGLYYRTNNIVGNVNAQEEAVGVCP